MKRPISLREFLNDDDNPYAHLLGVLAAVVLIGTIGLVIGGLAAGVGL